MEKAKWEKGKSFTLLGLIISVVSLVILVIAVAFAKFSSLSLVRMGAIFNYGIGAGATSLGAGQFVLIGLVVAMGALAIVGIVLAFKKNREVYLSSIVLGGIVTLYLFCAFTLTWASYNGRISYVSNKDFLTVVSGIACIVGLIGAVTLFLAPIVASNKEVPQE